MQGQAEPSLAPTETAAAPAATAEGGDVAFGYLTPRQRLPRLATPAVPGLDLASWASGERQRLAAELAVHGGILFRGFGLGDVEDFERVAQAFTPGLLEYGERSSPRSQVKGKVYTSTDYPASQAIFLHNENSYQSTWPTRIFFFCATAPEEGGETPLADCRRVYRRVDPVVRRRFAEKGWRYARNFGDGFGLAWESVFQTSDRAAVDAYCRQHGIVNEWRGDGRLRTWARRPAAARHPGTGEAVWFNHATFFHVSTLPEAVREGLLDEFAEDELPAQSYYGDGSTIEPETLDHLREAYAAETVSFPWQRGDLLLLDNMLVAHGRAPYKGPRKILVAMAEPTGWSEVEPAEA